MSTIQRIVSGTTASSTDGNYRLASSSLGYGADPSGFDLGCDHTLLESLMSEVV